MGSLARTFRKNTLGLLAGVTTLLGPSFSTLAQSNSPSSVPSVDIEQTFSVPWKNGLPLNAGLYCKKGIYSSVALDTNGKMIMGCNEDKPLSPASMTKLLTAYTVMKDIECGYVKMDDTLKTHYPASYYQAGRGLYIVGLPVGGKLTTRQALEWMLIHSAADAAEIFGENTSPDGGTDPRRNRANFIKRMNTYAKELGMTNSYFTNPSGYPDPAQVSTANDMAKALSANINNPELYKTLQLDSVVHPLKPKVVKYNHARIKGMPKTMFGKTGKTNISASTTVVWAPYEDTSYIICVYGGKNPVARNEHVKEIYEQIIQTYQPPEAVRLSPDGPAPLKPKDFKSYDINKTFRSNIEPIAAYQPPGIPAGVQTSSKPTDQNRIRNIFGLRLGGGGGR